MKMLDKTISTIVSRAKEPSERGELQYLVRNDSLGDGVGVNVRDRNGHWQLR